MGEEADIPVLVGEICGMVNATQGAREVGAKGEGVN